MTMLLQFVVSFGFILVVNAPQNMVAYGTETFEARDFVRTGLVLTVIAFALVMVLGRDLLALARLRVSRAGPPTQRKTPMAKMKAAIFVEPGRIVLDDKPIPDVGPLDALIRITTTTICGTDVHILKGEYPVARGLTVGHEPVGVIEKLGSAVVGLPRGPARHRRRDHAERPQLCLPVRLRTRRTAPARRTASRPSAAGGSATPSTAARPSIVLVPDAMANLSPIPDDLTDEQVLMCPDIMSTGFSRRRKRAASGSATRWRCSRRARSACAPWPGAQADGRDDHHRRRHRARAPGRRAAARRRPRRRFQRRPIRSSEIMRLTDGRGVDVAIEALGTQGTFEAALRVLRPGGTLSSLGVYSGDLTIPLDAFAAGLGDHTIVTTLCPGGKERMRRLMDGDRLRPRRPAARWSRTASSSTRSRRPTSCSPTSATACSRWRSRLEAQGFGSEHTAGSVGVGLAAWQRDVSRLSASPQLSSRPLASPDMHVAWPAARLGAGIQTRIPSVRLDPGSLALPAKSKISGKSGSGMTERGKRSQLADEQNRVPTFLIPLRRPVAVKPGCRPRRRRRAAPRRSWPRLAARRRTQPCSPPHRPSPCAR